MTKFMTTAGTTLALALAVAAAPVHAQLLGGGLGGGLGGAASFPGGSIGSMGNIGVSRIPGGVTTTSDGSATVTRTVRAPRVPRQAAATGSVTSAVTAPELPNAVAKVQAVRAPALPNSSSGARVVAVPALPQVAVVSRGVVLPHIADVAVRREAIIEAGIAPVPVFEVPNYVDRQYVTLQDDLRGTGVAVHKRGDQIVLDLPSDVNFAFNKYDIQPRFYRVLNSVSRTLARYPASYVDVNGHTDAIGSYSYNQVLSERRADSVADYLTARDVNGARLHVEGFGKTEPIASNATVEGRAANRRVEIILTPYAS
ncbi:MAG: hypothetical protein RLZZ444_4685 [Pseudomonadota bacterium]